MMSFPIPVFGSTTPSPDLPGLKVTCVLLVPILLGRPEMVRVVGVFGSIEPFAFLNGDTGERRARQ
jgi:hypothetical protein